MELNELSGEVIAAAIEVHRQLGPGLLESSYEACLCRELGLRGVPFEHQRELSVTYKGIELDCGYRLDVVVDNRLLLELKSVEQILPIHEAPLLTYLKLTKLKLGLLINFNVPILKRGVKRFVNNLKTSVSSASSASLR
ncbi:GxxExxY protein [Thiohalomonas denitrificans]|uniref:GxxExxY protein n=1 Tax=Thiohalomonas denitrificans TaxID=415747 RepID=UPI0026EDF30B|nr:GxxExxY protein [Thiohalomonas denitrificans]